MTTALAAPLRRDQIEAFLDNCTQLMQSEASRSTLKDSAAGRPGMALVGLQREVWDEMGIATRDGRAAIAGIERAFPNDHALVSLREAFMKSVDVAYLQSLEDRRPSVLKKKGALPRPVLLEFFDACNVKLDTVEVKERLLRHIVETGTLPDVLLNELHDEVMELLGYDSAHAQACFEELGKSKKFAQDQELAISHSRWQGKTSSTCLSLLEQHRKDGGHLNVPEETRGQLLEFRAQAELREMSPDDRAKMLEKWAKKVNVVRGLPPESRERYLERLSDEERIELSKSEMLMAQLVQSQSQAPRQVE